MGLSLNETMLFPGFDRSSGRDDLLQRLPKDFDSSDLYYFQSVGSTNDILKSVPERLARGGMIAIAEQQSAGRGRRGNSFYSEQGKGLYISCLFDCTDFSEAELYSFTSRSAVEICSILSETCGIKPGIKWVNDIICNERKIGGILTEAHTMQGGKITKLVFGLGLNINNTVFPPDLEGKAGSLLTETGREYSVPELTAAIVQGIRKLGRTRSEEEYLSAYRALSVSLGREVQYELNGERREGTAVGIDDNYSLIVRTAGGEEHLLNAGMVSIRTANGYL